VFAYLFCYIGFEVYMPLIQVEQKDDKTYRALRNGRTVATGDTQEKTAQNAAKRFPDDTIEVERVRNTKNGTRDTWRRW
jgi:hypothetical protein